MCEKQTEKGSVLVFVALMLPFLILFAGVAIDIGRAYLYKSYMQNAADTAALAGAEMVGGSKARLIKVADVPVLGQYIKTEYSRKADSGADRFLAMDTGGNWQTGGSNIQTELRKEVNIKKNSPILQNRAVKYYYKVELADDYDFKFAKLFLPQSLLPADWKVKTEAWAVAENNPLKGIDLLTQMLEVEAAYTVSSYQEQRARNKGKGEDYIKQISFTNKGPAYNAADSTRSEVFDLDGTNTINNSLNDLLVDFKPDIRTTAKLTGNWDLDVIENMTPEEVSAYYSANNMKVTNWRIIDANGVVVEENEGGITTWSNFYNKLKNKVGAAKATEIISARIKSIINVTHPYAVRDVMNLPASEISYDVYTDTPNKLDPLFIRIESEEYNMVTGNDWVTNTVRDISINIKADNTEKDIYGDYKYRPMIFFYDGPVGEDEDGDGIGERGKGRKSKTVVLSLEEDFRGILFAPNSPVHVEGNGHKFQGIIIAEKFVDANGNTIDAPSYEGLNYSNLDSATADELQSFYAKLGFSEAKYDDFHAVRLSVYNNPNMDVAYTTGRSGITI